VLLDKSDFTRCLEDSAKMCVCMAVHWKLVNK